MKNLLNNIAGQLILLILGSVLLSQTLIILVFFVQAGERIEELEDFYTIDQIVSVYEKARNTTTAQRALLLEYSENPEVTFTITPQPLANTDKPSPIPPAIRFMLGDVEYHVSEKKPSSWDVWEFWFDDGFDNCLDKDSMSTIPEQCPHHILSLRLEDGQWLNAKTLPPPTETVLLLPVILAAFLTLASITVVVIIGVGRITAPLRQLSEAADKLGRGEGVQILSTNGPQEISSTSQAFNLMQERITRFIQDRTKMLAAISHDLRTPITALRINAEFVEDNELREKMITILTDMQVMVEACLSFSRQEVVEEEISAIDLVTTLDNLADESLDISFTTDMPACPYSCRNVNFKRAIRNLLENAVTYGDKAHMSLEKHHDHIAIVIEDRGPGIPEEKLEDIFEPFIRLDEARNTRAGSVGLGLSIARTIIHKHGGTIHALNAPQGLRLIVELPLQ